MFWGIIVQVFDVRMFLLLPIFCCYIFLIYVFVTAKAAQSKIVMKKLPDLGSEISNQ